MKYTTTLIELQTLASGETLTIKSYNFIGTKPGPTIYLQANLHGPEVFGTVLLGKLIHYLSQVDDISGCITIVPSANPVALQAVGYNGHIGRWNVQNGNNWNRIFCINKKWHSKSEQKAYYTKQLEKNNLSIEEKLAAQLSLLSYNATHIIDIHTTGIENENHLFTFNHSHNTFAHLEATVHIEEKANAVIGAFDESHVIPFLDTLPIKELVHVCTWEAHHHNSIDSKILDLRYQQLINCINNIWINDSNISKKPKHIIDINNSLHLVSPIPGYYIWEQSVGSHIKKGETYATVYQPWNNSYTEIKAEFDFILLGKYGVQAIATGEQIAWIAKI